MGKRRDENGRLIGVDCERCGKSVDLSALADHPFAARDYAGCWLFTHHCPPAEARGEAVRRHNEAVRAATARAVRAATARTRLLVVTLDGGGRGKRVEIAFTTDADGWELVASIAPMIDRRAVWHVEPADARAAENNPHHSGRDRVSTLLTPAGNVSAATDQAFLGAAARASLRDWNATLKNDNRRAS